MIKKILKITLPIILTIGTLIIAFGLTNIEGATIISSKSITYANYTWNYKYFDANLYLQNLLNTLRNDDMTYLVPNIPQLPNVPNNTDILGWVKFIATGTLFYILNWLIYVLDWLLLVPLKLLIYPLNLIITILGVNTSNNNYIKLITILSNWQIPFIPYL